MDNKLEQAFEGLDDSEKAEILARAEDVTREAVIADVNRLKERKAEGRKHEMLNQFIAELKEQNAIGKPWVVNRIKEKYRGQGLNFGKINFKTDGRGQLTASFVE